MVFSWIHATRYLQLTICHVSRSHNSFNPTDLPFPAVPTAADCGVSQLGVIWAVEECSDRTQTAAAAGSAAPAPAPAPLPEGTLATTITSPAPPSWRLYEATSPASDAGGAAFQETNTTLQQAPLSSSSPAPSPAPAPSPGIALAPVGGLILKCLPAAAYDLPGARMQLVTTS